MRYVFLNEAAQKDCQRGRRRSPSRRRSPRGYVEDLDEAAIRPKDPYNPTTALIVIENTHNAGGGSIYPLATIERIRAVASARGVSMHLDGARLFNAVVAT